jgi:hypothetical protein
MRLSYQQHATHPTRPTPPFPLANPTPAIEPMTLGPAARTRTLGVRMILAFIGSLPGGLATHPVSVRGSLLGESRLRPRRHVKLFDAEFS